MNTIFIIKLLLLKISFTIVNGYTGSYAPQFQMQLIEKNRQDGYWIEPFQLNNKSSIGLLAYGLAKGEIKFYPIKDKMTQQIEGTLIQKLDTPVGMNQADITGNGLNDIIICYQYGRTLIDNDPDGGKIVWLENPGEGNLENKLWNIHYVGKSPAMHRISVGHFTQNQRWEILGFPISSKPFDLLSAIPIFLFEQPEDLYNSSQWSFKLINDDYFHVIHDVKLIHDDPFDKLLIASREGITYFYFNQNLNKWILEKISDGEISVKQKTGYYGSGSLDIGRIKNDSFAYIAAAEPYHGHVLAVYMKNSINSLKDIQWKRYILDTYGQPNELGEGPIHHIVTADFDNDGNDEFLVALRGPHPTQGVYFYKLIDFHHGLFAKWKISDESAARIAVADFDNDGFKDFATVSYDVSGYHKAQNPSIYVFYNRFFQKKTESKKEIDVIKRNNRLVFNVTRPNKSFEYQSLSFLTIDGINLSLEILPPNKSRYIDNSTYIKVLYGFIFWNEYSHELNQTVYHSRHFLTKPKTVSPLQIKSYDNRITAGNEGALFIVFESNDKIHQFDHIDQILVENSIPRHFPKEVLDFKYEFVNYYDYTNNEIFKDLEFYNLKGFDIEFSDNSQHLCSMQLWAAGQGVSAGLHNHNNDFFCEVHASIINGNENSGMYYLNYSKLSYDPLTIPDSDLEKLEMPPFHEHGPLWEINQQNKPILTKNNNVVYPWHKWQSGFNKKFNQSFDIWIAFEFDIQSSTLP